MEKPMRERFDGPERDDGARTRGRGGGSRWRRRDVAIVGGTSGAVGIAGAAWADAPPPPPTTAVGTISFNAAGEPVLTVQGDWQWPTHGNKDCNSDRYAMGYAIDWHDPAAPGNLVATLNGVPIKVGTPTDNDVHTTVDPISGGLCGHLGPAPYPVGHWGPISHTYAKGTTSFTACAVTYDVHNPGELNPAGGPGHDGDNSVEKNGNTPGGNQCANIVIKQLTVSVTKVNNANGDATYSDDETAATAGASVPFRVTIKNTSTNSPVEITDVTDAFSGQTIDVCDGGKGNNVIGTQLAVGASVTCDFSLPGYSPAAGGSLQNTVNVVVQEPG